MESLNSYEFFKVFLSSMCSNRLALPPAFGVLLGGRISSNCWIEDPQMKRWRVELGKKDATFVIQHGWKNFALHHRLVDGDILHFEYNDNNSEFKVKIFGNRGMLKDAENRGCELQVASTNNEWNPMALSSDSEEEEEEEEDLFAVDSFSVIVSESTRYCVKLPSWWFSGHEIEKGDKISLINAQGQRWEAALQRNGKWAQLGKGWRRFWRDNNIVYGDSCVIELVPSQGNYGSLRVHVGVVP